jgi:hypothetical protein
VRDQQTFQREHADLLMVVTAYGAWASWVPKGFVGCHAYVGGRGERGQTNGVGRAFLVTAAEYDVRSHMVSSSIRQSTRNFPSPFPYGRLGDQFRRYRGTIAAVTAIDKLKSRLQITCKLFRPSKSKIGGTLPQAKQVEMSVANVL